MKNKKITNSNLSKKRSENNLLHATQSVALHTKRETVLFYARSTARIVPKQALFIVALVFLFAGIFLVPAADEGYVCCEKTSYGYCQDIPAGQVESVCLGSVSATSCSGGGTFNCRLGTCLNENEGICSQNSPKLICENEGGAWYDKKIEEVPGCQKGCCVIGTSSAFVTDAECERLATEYGVPKSFRGDITSESVCQEFADLTELGACVYEGTSGSKPCTIETKENCKASRGKFYKEMLCTATGISDCAKSTKTSCKEGSDDVYFLDSCGNYANIYDPRKSKDSGYWEKIKDSTCYGDENCGDCNYAEGTKCVEEKGVAFCGSLSCTDEKGNKIAEHGESWCAQTTGATQKINIDTYSHAFSKTTIRENLEDSYEEANLPGSRYYKLLCWEGEIIQEDCMDYRNSICKETVLDEGFRSANCWVNRWRECFDLDSRTECEDNSMDCKWIGGKENYWGYRFDGTKVNYNGEDTVQKEEREERQGSCVPLYAPGFDFWEGYEEAQDASSICSMGKVVETATFETRVNRETFSGWSTKAAASRCFEGACYALPDYGLDEKLKSDLDKTLAIHNGNNAPDALSDIYLSSRRGYYCHKSGKEEASLTGSTGGLFSNDKQASCADSASKRKDIPLFLNHGVWVDFIQERTRSLGDCGYKKNFVGDYGQETSEVMTAVFQKLSQKGEVKDNESSKTSNIYIGDRRVTDENYRPSAVYDNSGKKPFYWRTYDWWKQLHSTKTPNVGTPNPVEK